MRKLLLKLLLFFKRLKWYLRTIFKKRVYIDNIPKKMLKEALNKNKKIVSDHFKFKKKRFLGVLKNYYKNSDQRNFENKHLKAYLNGQKEFKYKGKTNLVAYGHY